MRTQVLLFYFLVAGALSLVLVSDAALAQTSSLRDDVFSQLNRVAGTGGADLGEYRDPRAIVANYIKTGLALLGTVFFCLMIYAGLVWMLAAGQEENIAKATKILKTSIIGLIIILCAYAITVGIVERLIQTTTGDNNVPDVCVDNPTDPSCAL